MPLPSRPVGERVLMRDEAYRDLRRLIVEGTLAPAERLRDKDVAAWLGVSRTPVREALTRLADEDLVELAPNRFTRVTPLRASDAAEGYPIAAALHALAAELAAGALAGEERGPALERLGEEAERYAWALLREDDIELVAADDALHALIVEASGNAQLERHLERVVPRLRRLELNGPAIGGRRPDVHRAVIDALSAGDGSTAARLVSDEWRALGELVRRRPEPAG